MDGKKNLLVSILGDSISTFEGYSFENYPCFYTPEKCRELGLGGVSDTWWMKLIKTYGWTYLKNSSYSGWKVLDCAFDSLTAEEQARQLRSDKSDPDLILIYLGVNDFACGVPERWIPVRGKELLSFGKAYSEMLNRLRSMYPDAMIVCGTLMRTTIKDRPDWIFPNSFGGRPLERYNAEIRCAAKQEKCHVAELEATGIRYETLDGVHPTVKGHADMAEAWADCLCRLVPQNFD